MASSDSSGDKKTVIVPKPDCSFEKQALPSVFGGIHPGHLLQRALNHPRTSKSPGDWDPPEPEEIQRRFHLQGRTEYTIQKLVGYGGMGAVYAAQHANFDTPRAIKIMRPEFAFSDAFSQSFANEARTLEGLEHPGLVRVYDSGCLKGGDDAGGLGPAASRSPDLFFIVMELLCGNNLRKELKKGLLPEDCVLGIFSQICAAMAAAHEKRVIHRDLKPDNIFLSRAQSDKEPSSGSLSHQGITGISAASPMVVKVLDFGLALRVIPEAAGKAGAPGTSLFIEGGTPPYKAPEQNLDNELPQPASTRTDVWALGVILYEMIAGKWPDPGSWEVPSKIRGGLAVLDDIVRGCLEDNPERRYQSAQEVSDKLQDLVNAPRIAAELEKQVSINRRLTNRLMAAVCFAIIAVVAGIIAHQRQKAAEHERMISEQTRQSAATLIENLLGNLHPQLEKTGRLDLLQTISTTTLDYFNHLPATEWNEVSVRNHAWVLKCYGDVERKEGHMEAATEAYTKHSELLKKLHESFPQRQDLAREYAQALGEVGKIWELRGDTLKAAAYFENQLQILSSSAPASDVLMRTAQAAAWENQGCFWSRTADFGKAASSFDEQMKICQELADSYPDAPDLERNLAKSHGNQGDLSFEMQHYSKASDEYLKQEQILSNLCGNARDDMRLLSDLAIAWNKVGKAQQKKGDIERARIAFTQFYDKISYLLHEVEPQNPVYQRLLAISHSNLGDVALLLHKLDDAEAHYKQDLGLSEKLADNHSDDSSDDQVDLGMSYVNMAGLRMRQGRPEEADQFLNKAMSQMEKARTMDPSSPKLRKLEERIAKARNPP